MAVRTMTERDAFARTTTNTPSGAAIFDGSFSIDRFDPRAGMLLDVAYRLDIKVAVTGGLVNDGTTSFGSAEVRYGVDLDASDADPDDVDAFVLLPADSGLPAIRLLGGTASTPVFFTVQATSGSRDAGEMRDFTGAGDARFDFTALSGVLAIGGSALGPQGGSFTNVNTGTLSVIYSYRPAIDGGARRDTLTGTRDADVLSGRGRDDRLAGREGSDVLNGDDGADRLNGGRNGDRLFGGRGDDTIIGGKGSDILRGGNGADSFVLAEGRGQDRIDDWGGRDRLDLRGLDARRADIDLVEAGRDLRVLVDGDLVAVLMDTSRSDVQQGDVLF